MVVSCVCTLTRDIVRTRGAVITTWDNNNLAYDLTSDKKKTKYYELTHTNTTLAPI